MADREIRTVTDSRGRKIEYRNLSVLEQSRLYLAAGAVNAENEAWIRLARVAACVLKIDGVPRPRVQSFAQIEAAIEALDDEGYLAIFVAQQAEIDAAMAEIEMAKANTGDQPALSAEEVAAKN